MDLLSFLSPYNFIIYFYTLFHYILSWEGGPLEQNGEVAGAMARASAILSPYNFIIYFYTLFHYILSWEGGPLEQNGEVAGAMARASARVIRALVFFLPTKLKYYLMQFYQ